MFRKSKKVLLTLLVILVLASSTYAFAAANIVPDSAAGYKASAVPGYTISNIVYDLNTANPTRLDKIIFNIAPTGGIAAPAVTVKISTTLVQDFTTSECVVTAAGTLVTCTFGTVAVPVAINVVDVVQLDIVATSSTNSYLCSAKIASSIYMIYDIII